MAIKNIGSGVGTIELPTQTGNSGKFLTTNGTAPSWDVTAVTMLGHLTGVGTSAAFGGIPQTYKHIKVMFRFNNSTTTQIRLRINNNSMTFNGGMNYYSSTTAVGGMATSNSTDLIISYISGSNAGACLEINIPDYAGSKRKAVSAFGGGTNNSGWSSFGGSSQSATAISQLSIEAVSGTFDDYTATLYGWN